MRITLDLDDVLIKEAKLSARAEGISLSAYVERELRAFLTVLDDKHEPRPAENRAQAKP